MAWDPGLGRVVLYGGRLDGGRAASDTWTWAGGAWTQLHPAASPGPLEGAAMAADAAHHGLVLFGGTADGKHGDHVLLAPPYICTPDDIDMIVDRLGSAVESALKSINH